MRALASGTLLAGTGVAMWASPAAAAGGEQGALRIHAVGSVYAGSASIVTGVTTPGGTVTYALQVLNTGTAPAQYNLRVHFGNCGGTCFATSVLKAGSLDVSSVAKSANGYFTTPINPGKSATYSFRVTMPRTGVPDSFDQTLLQLFDTAGTQLDAEDTITTIKATTGVRAYDEFINGAGQQPISGDHLGVAAVSTPVLAVGKKSTFTIKLVNNSATPAAIPFWIGEGQGCDVYFPVTVKVGTVDITASVFANTYSTPVLAPKASKVLTMTVLYETNAHACLPGSEEYWRAASGGFQEFVFLEVPIAP